MNATRPIAASEKTPIRTQRAAGNYEALRRSRRGTLRLHRNALGTPATILRRLDRQTGAIFKARYPMRYADWFYLIAARWLNVPVWGGALIVVVALLLHLPRLIVGIGLTAWIIGVVGVALGIVPAVLQQIWQWCRAVEDSEPRRVLIAARETVAFRDLCRTTKSARTLCRQRCIDGLARAYTIPALCAGAVTFYITKGFRHFAVLEYAGTHRDPVIWLALLLTAVVLFGLIAASHLRRHIYLITISLDQDPQTLKLARLPWLPKP